MSITAKTRDAGGDIRGRRLAIGLTQQQLAARAHCSIAMVALLEGGYRPARGSAVLDRVTAVIEAPATAGQAGAATETAA